MVFNILIYFFSFPNLVLYILATVIVADFCLTLVVFSHVSKILKKAANT